MVLATLPAIIAIATATGCSDSEVQTTTAASAPSPATDRATAAFHHHSRPARSTRCDQNISAGPHTTCGFADNVFKAYVRALAVDPGSESGYHVDAKSPTTGRTYSMVCRNGGGDESIVTCTGGAGATVRFTLHAAEEYESSPPAPQSSAPNGESGSVTEKTAPKNKSGEHDEVGSSSHATDAQFCSEHECIGSFESEGGAIVKCSDGSYSHAGGISGACSHHGGES